nr:hypothetical protein SYMBAF_50151 [Serratia symbiotica]
MINNINNVRTRIILGNVPRTCEKKYKNGINFLKLQTNFSTSRILDVLLAFSYKG